jgi:protein gp37
MENSTISWTDNTFNPWMGCTKISPGCHHCYAETLTKNRMRLDVWGPKAPRQVTSGDNWKKPLQWNQHAKTARRRMRVFSGSICDVFEDHPVAHRARPHLFALIRQTPYLDWQLLTKRADQIEKNLPDDWAITPWPHVWLGVSVEDRRYGLPRIDILRNIPAHIRFLSIEPLLEDLGPLDLTGIHQVLVGGESGQGYRPMNHAWARHIRDQCVDAHVAFFFKQSAAYRTEQGVFLQEEDGSFWKWHQYPHTLTPPEKIL